MRFCEKKTVTCDFVKKRTIPNCGEAALWCVSGRRVIDHGDKSGLANQKTQKPKNPGFFKVFSGFFQKIFEKTRFFQNFSKKFGKYDQSLTKFGKYDQSLTKKNIIYF